MANHAVLKAAIEAVIRENGNNEITGPLLQQTLIAMVNNLGAGFQYSGKATEAGTPGAPDQNVFFVAAPGTYPNYGGVTVPEQSIGFISYNGTWAVSLIETSPLNAREVADDIIQLYDGDTPVYPQTKSKAVLLSDDTSLYETIEAISNPEFIFALVDKDGRLLYGIDKSGKHILQTHVIALGGISSPEIDQLKHIFERTENEEFIESTVDAKGKMTEGLRSDGIKEFFVPVRFNNKVFGLPEGEKVPVVDSLFKDKSIAWYGTSIPAGSAYELPIKGNEINAKLSGYSNANTLQQYTANDNLPSEYPIIAASIVGAKNLYNEAVGSSRAVRNTTSSNLLLRCKALGNTVREICSYIWGSYNIDIANRTFAENHDNTIGITTFLTTAGTWSSFVNNVFMILRYSYQICLVASYLCEDETQWQNYIEEIFGEYFNDVTAFLATNGYSMERLAGYVGADLFVLEHSVNDGGNLFTGDVTSTDVNTFEGAYNLFISTILRYKPSARIAIVSNYSPLQSEVDANKIKSTYLKAIAERWHIPFLDMANYSQVVLHNVRTQGYWDAQQNWHNSGFTWIPDAGNDSYQTNCNFPEALASTSLAQMIANVNPQQIDGVWTWEASDLYLWMWDGLHPHSDKSGRLTMLLGKVLAEFLEKISII